MIFCPGGGSPEGAGELSPGFQPWEPFNQMFRPETARVATRWARVVSAFVLAPLQGASSGEVGVPGLKPWAESYGPVGAKNRPKQPLTSRHSHLTYPYSRHEKGQVKCEMTAETASHVSHGDLSPRERRRPGGRNGDRARHGLRSSRGIGLTAGPGTRGGKKKRRK
jgi:hypothetical protein